MNNYINSTMAIRVGRIKYPDFKVTPVHGFETIYVMTDSFPGEFNILSPFAIKDEYGRIMENVWQFSRVFPIAFKKVRPRGFKDKKMATSSEELVSHTTPDGQLTDDYMLWRKTGCNYPTHIRYSNGLHDKTTAMYAYKEKEAILSTDTLATVRDKLDSIKLDYVESRKQIYVPMYIKIVRQQPMFEVLKQKLRDGKSLLIIEVDGPHQESLQYYKQKYGVTNDFITNHSMLVNQSNIDIMLNDPIHNFGHGYCLAMALLDLQIV